MANLDAILKITAKGDASGLAPVQAGLLSLEATGKRASGVMGSFGSAIGAATGGVIAFGAGIAAASVVAYTKNIIDAADNMRDLSQKTGASVEMLSKFQQQANMSGSNIDEVGKAMIKLGKNLAEVAETGKGKAADALRYLGISAVDAADKLKTPDQVMLELADKFQNLPNGAKKAELAIDLMGKSGANMVPGLNEGRQAIEKLSASFDQKFADDADTYNDSVTKLGVTFQKFGAVLAKEFLPIMQNTVDGLTLLGIKLRILNLPFVGKDKVKEIQAIRSELKAYYDDIEQRKVKKDKPIPTPEEDENAAAAEAAAAAIEKAKQQQEAFNAAIEQSNASYRLLGQTIDATSQAIQRQGQLRDATLTADIAVNNAAKSILEAKLSQTRTDAEKIPILKQIMGIELENARLQKAAADEQIRQEVLIADLKRRKAWEELRSADAALATAAAYGQQTAKLQEQVSLMKLAANSADSDYKLQQQIATQKLRTTQAQFQAQRTQIMNSRQLPSAASTPTGSGRTFNGAPVLSDGRTGMLVNGVLTYAGGGYTGNAPRSGGIDGQGGFLAMLHPRETVVDHARTGASGGVPNITIQTGQVLQMPDGSQWVSMADLERAMQATAAGIMGQLRTPAGRVALGGA